MKTKIGWRNGLTNIMHWMIAGIAVRNNCYELYRNDLGIRTAILACEDRIASPRIWESMK